MPDNELPKDVLMEIKAPNGAVLTVEQHIYSRYEDSGLSAELYNTKCESVRVFTECHRESYNYHTFAY